MRLFQLTSQARVAVRDAREGEEAILEMTRQEGTVLQVVDRPSLGVQRFLYALDDISAMGQEDVKKLEMSLKRRAKSLCDHGADELYVQCLGPFRLHARATNVPILGAAARTAHRAIRLVVVPPRPAEVVAM